MWFLKINGVTYAWKNYSYKSKVFRKWLNIIEGTNWVWKSTLSDLIYYGLWWDVKHFIPGNRSAHREISNDENNQVELEISINSIDYKLRRSFSDSNKWTIIVSEQDELNIFSINRSKTETYIFSDWILEKLWLKQVEVTSWGSTWLLWFNDLLRLIYWDQKTSPEDIFKITDSVSFIDSKYLRATIFEVLLSINIQEYNTADTQNKKLLYKKDSTKKLLEEMIVLTETLNDNTEERKNLIYLEKEKKELIDKIHLLAKKREKFNLSNIKNSVSGTNEISVIKDNLYNIETQSSDLVLRKKIVIDEKADLSILKDNINLELRHLNKIIYTNDNLKLFSKDTCPYCLEDVERLHNSCICWKTIIEESYEKFFYSSEEYIEILKSKKKSIKTIDLAQLEYDYEIQNIDNQIKINNTQAKKLKKDIKDSINYSSDPYLKERREIDNEILSAKEELLLIDQKIHFEEKIDKLQLEYDNLIEEHKESSTILSNLKTKIYDKKKIKIKSFNSVYNTLMKNAMPWCRHAAIDDDYMPVINYGEYKERSSVVHIRLLYFFTLLYLSLEFDDIIFPRFLLIDTPETSWIDRDKLNIAIIQLINAIPIPKSIKLDFFTKLSSNEKEIFLSYYDLIDDSYKKKTWEEKQDIKQLFMDNLDYQVILFTWIWKFPGKFSSYLIDTIEESDRLLKKNTTK